MMEVFGVEKVRVLGLQKIRLLFILIFIEAEDIAIKRIDFIPCFMEKKFKTADWLEFLMGANVYVDFSDTNNFDTSVENLISEITSIEGKLSTNPREF
jgi:hypothetical protein